MSNGTIGELQADEGLPAIAESNPHDAARIAAEFLLAAMDRLKVAAWQTRRGKDSARLTRMGAKQLPKYVARLEHYMTDAVCDAAMATHDGLVACCGLDETCYIRVVYRLAGRWLLALGFVDDVTAKTKVDVERIVREWPEAVRVAERFGLVEVDSAFLKNAMYREYRTARQAAAVVEWSQEDSPSRWAKRFGVALNTLKKRADEKVIRVDKVSQRRWRIAVEDLPRPRT